MRPGDVISRQPRLGRLVGRLAVIVAIATVSACSSGSAPASVASIDPNAVKLVASGQQFVTKEASAPAGKPFQVVFESQTADAHNLAIAVAGSDPVFRSEVFTGPATKIFSVEALAAGSYVFRCDLHSGMTGTLTVR